MTSGKSLSGEINRNVHSYRHTGQEYSICVFVYVCVYVPLVDPGKMAFVESPVLCNITE